MSNTAECLYARTVYGETLLELGKKDPDIVVCDADLSGSTKTALFGKEFPERFFNFGVAEQNMMATAAGLASCGKTVFVSTFAMFATARALDQVRNSICYNNFNVKIVATHGGITVGEDGASHQAIEDIAFFRPLVNMHIIVPCDGPEARDAVITAYKTPGPFYIRLGRAKIPTVQGKKTFALGKGCVLKEGKDLAIIATGLMVSHALEASRILEQKKINAAVVNIHTIKPVDKELIISLAEKYKVLMVCEEHQVTGSLYSSVCEVVCPHHPVRVVGVGIEDRFGQSGSPAELLEEYGLSSKAIADRAEKLIRG